LLWLAQLSTLAWKCTNGLNALSNQGQRGALYLSNFNTESRVTVHIYLTVCSKLVGKKLQYTTESSTGLEAFSTKIIFTYLFVHTFRLIIIF